MLVNLENLKLHFDGDEELILELLEVFESTYPGTLTSVETAIKEQSFSDLELHAHTLKGMIANFFSEELKEAAFRLEKSGREKKDEGLDQPLKVLQEKLPLLVEEIRTSF